jgi:hypothetical protein
MSAHVDEAARIAVEAIRYNLPVDEFGQARRLQEYTAIWGNAVAKKLGAEGLLAPSVAPSDRQFAADVLVKAYHEEYCEYDGMEDGVAVCAGGCREFAQSLAGVEPSKEACS